MKYDILNPYKEYMYQNYKKNTAKKYCASIERLFKDVQFNNLSEISKDFLEKETASKFKTKSDFSAVKNGLKALKKCNPDLNLPDENFFKQTSQKKRNWSKKAKNPIYLDSMNKKINQISNVKLKLGYRLALVSGLRVSELAALEKEDISFKDGNIVVHVTNGKGGSNGYVTCEKDAYLYKSLQEYVDNLEEGKMFYSASHMQNMAKKLGLECHDFRRVFAIRKRCRLKKEMSAFEANKEVQKALRHERFSTTKRYLFNKKLIIRRVKK